MSQETQTGGGTRPMTDGTVDNIGAGESFVPGQAPGTHGPAPTERMSAKRSDAESVENDDSASFDLTTDAEDVRADKTRETPSDQER